MPGAANAVSSGTGVSRASRGISWASRSHASCTRSAGSVNVSPAVRQVRPPAVLGHGDVVAEERVTIRRLPFRLVPVIVVGPQERAADRLVPLQVHHPVLWPQGGVVLDVTEQVVYLL